MRKTGGSLVHSIPKFSKVRPSEKLSEVQKVLQDRILSRQRMKHQRQHQKHDITDLSSKTVCVKSSDIVSSTLHQHQISRQSEEDNFISNISAHDTKCIREPSARKRVRKPGKRALSFIFCN